MKKEADIKKEYDKRIQELTADYRSKLDDLDKDYYQRKAELDKEEQKLRAAYEQQAEQLSQLGGNPFTPLHDDIEINTHRYDPDVFKPIPGTGHQPGMHPVIYPIKYADERPDLAPYMQLAHRGGQANEVTDPMADIKRRERDLQHERQAREQELQREYEKRLAEFEMDFEQKERELEKEKLYMEKRILQERARELMLQEEEDRRLR